MYTPPPIITHSLEQQQLAAFPFFSPSIFHLVEMEARLRLS